ncbi:MAG: hypothetical protein H7141_09895 [Burkholderiales bacterium]|nr:hypothetical protein [Bacteroidia bacterium]
MKKLVIISNLAILLFASCATLKKGTATTDDVYANPKEYRSEEIKLAAERKQAQEVADKRYNDSIASVEKAQKDKDEANPYYKDREFKYDDYYDYEYATRVKRFNNNINGLSYYDNYYTNSYWYNQNPYNYGVSVYNGYSWWGSSYNSYSYNPSVNFYNSWGWNCNSGYGYNGYNPYMAGYAAGYNNGFNNGMYGNYYGFGNPYGYGNQFGYGNPYGYGGGYGYNNPYNNGWGYYNSYDYNSSYTYGFRSSHGGGNSRRTSNPGMIGKRDSYLEKYVDEVKEQQVRTVKFSDSRTTLDQPVRVPAGTGGIKAPHTGTNGGNVPIRSNEPIRYNEPIRSNEPIRINEPIRNSNPPVRQNPIKTVEPIRQPIETTPRFETPIRQNNPTPNIPTNNGGSNPPSNNSGGHRPR